MALVICVYVNCPIVLKFGRLVHYESAEPASGQSRERLEGRAAWSGNAALITTFSNCYFDLIWYILIWLLVNFRLLLYRTDRMKNAIVFIGPAKKAPMLFV